MSSGKGSACQPARLPAAAWRARVCLPPFLSRPLSSTHTPSHHMPWSGLLLLFHPLLLLPHPPAACSPAPAGFMSVAHYLVLNKVGGLEAKRVALDCGMCPPELEGESLAQHDCN